jgi:hypothetical protein
VLSVSLPFPSFFFAPVAPYSLLDPIMRTGFLPATLLALPLLASALPFRKSESVSKPVRRKAVNVPIKQWKRPGANLGLARRQSSDGTPAPAVGLGDLGDLIYAVSVNMGGTDVAVHMGA